MRLWVVVWVIACMCGPPVKGMLVLGARGDGGSSICALSPSLSPPDQTRRTNPPYHRSGQLLKYQQWLSRVLRLLHTKMASMNAPREVEENMEETSRFQQNFGRLSVWEVLGIVSTFRQNVERMKLYRATLSVVRFMAVLNFIYTVVGTAFLVIGLFPKIYEALDISHSASPQFLKLGKSSFSLLI